MPDRLPDASSPAEIGPSDVEVAPSSLVANSAIMLLAQGFSVLVGGGVSIYAIRTLSVEDWGTYSTALALIAVFTVFSGLGIGQLALREMTADPAGMQAVVARSLGSLIITCSAAATVLAPTVLLLGYSSRVLLVILIVSPLLLFEPTATLAQAAFNARRSLRHVARFQVARSATYAVLAVALLVGGAGILGLATASLIGALVSLSIAAGSLRRRLGVRPAISFHRTRPALRAAIPIAGVSIVGILYSRLDVLMLSKLDDVASVATYSVPYSLVQLSWIVPSIVASAFFPILSRAIAASETQAHHLFFLVVRLFLFASLPISLLLAVGSPTILKTVFGGYGDSVGVLQIMAWTSVLGFENYVLWYGIFAVHRERMVLVLQIAGLVLNGVLNLLLIPRFGPKGAAGALIASDLMVVIGQAAIVHRYLFRFPLTVVLAKPAGAAAVVVPTTVLAGREWSPLGAATCGALAYAGILLATRYIKPAEWKPLTSAANAVAAGVCRFLSPA
jgi:O-antigen/teichoic acid export membrane protein